MSASYSFLTITDPADPAFNEAAGINDAGQIAGSFGNGNVATGHPGVAFTASPLYGQGNGTFVSPTLPAGGSSPYVQSRATGINNLATLEVGYAINQAGVATAVVIAAGAGSVAGAGAEATVAAPTGAVQSFLLGVNDLKTAVGYYLDSAGTAHAYEVNGLSSTGSGTATMLAAPTIAGASVVATEAAGINNGGLIAGTATTKATGSTVTSVVGYLELNGSSTILSGPAGATRTVVLGLNNQGQVVGDYADAAGVTHGFVYSAATGTYTTVDGPAGAGSDTITGINDQGDIVGYYTNSTGTHGLLGVAQTLQTVSNPLAATTVAALPGSLGVSVGGSAALTLSDPGVGHVTLSGNAGADTLTAAGSADTLVGGIGNDVFTTGTLTSGNELFLGSGANSVSAAGAALVVQSSGKDTVSPLASTTVFGGAAATASLQVTESSKDTAGNVIVGGGGTTFVSAISSAADLVFGGSGTLFFASAVSTVAGAAQARTTVVGGSGASTIAAGVGGGLIWGGTGSNLLFGNNQSSTASAATIVGGVGASTIIAQAGTVAVLIGAAPSLIQDASTVSGSSTVSSANVTLAGAASSGNDTLVLGSGNDLVTEGTGTTDVVLGTGQASIFGGAGQDIYNVLQSSAGGSDTVYGFKVGTDLVALGPGYNSQSIKTALQSEKSVAGSARLSLTGGATITFYGIGHIDAGSIIL